MIVLVNNPDKKRVILKSLSMVLLLVMFYLYYNHMSQKFRDENFHLNAQLDMKAQEQMKLTSKTVQFENLIFEEAKTLTELLEQKHIQSIKITNDKLLIICDYLTNIEPLLIRYGANALVKSTDKNIKIAIDVAFIVENKYEAL